MKALTLHQPWASLIGNPPLKNIENRTWRPPAGILGQRIAIHAGKAYDRSATFPRGWIEATTPNMVSQISRFDAGAIVSTAIVSGWYDSRVPGADEEFAVAMGPDDVRLTFAIVRTKESPWWIGPVGWLLTDVIRLREPIPCKGAQGLWTVPKDIEERISR